MSKPTETYDRFEVVKVPFPFADIKTAKRRPALILSPARHFNAKVGATIMAMITSVKPTPAIKWPMDVIIEDLESVGLPVPSLIRMKLFTLDHRLILGRLGKLSKRAQQKVNKQIKLLFGF